MRRRLAMFFTASAATLAFIGAGTASAAVEFGDNCAADEGTGPATLVTLAAPGSALPLTAPVGGVITKVKMQIAAPIPITFPQQVKVLRPAGGNAFTAVADTIIQVGAGSNQASVRMPVQAGDRLGLHGVPFSVGEMSTPGFEVYCKNQPGSRIGGAPGDVPVGSTATFSEGPEAQVPLAALIEPDVDNDGFGDETQDACPQSAAVQTACPVISLDASAQLGKKAVTVLVTASAEGLVGVKGVVKLGKGKKATLTAKAKTVVPGKLVPFKLKFSAKLRKRLTELEPSRKLTLKITASATNVAGQISTDKLKVKLKGQA